MNQLELRRLSGETFGPLDRVLASGKWTVLARDAIGASDLFSFVTGRSRPRRGAVLLNGAAPFRSSTARRAIAAVFPDESYEELTVSGAVGRVLELRRSARSPAELLGAFELAHLGGRSARSLSPSDSKAVALALALGGETPALLALFEPLVTHLARERIIAEVSRHARAGAVVLAVTASVRDASDLGGGVFVFHRGCLVDLPQSIGSVTVPGTPFETVVLVDDSRKFAARVACESSVHAVALDVDRAPFEVTVAGADPEGVALAIQTAAKNTGVSILALCPKAPSLDAVCAGSTGFGSPAAAGGTARAGGRAGA